MEHKNGSSRSPSMMQKDAPNKRRPWPTAKPRRATPGLRQNCFDNAKNLLPPSHTLNTNYEILSKNLNSASLPSTSGPREQTKASNRPTPYWKPSSCSPLRFLATLDRGPFHEPPYPHIRRPAAFCPDHPSGPNERQARVPDPLRVETHRRAGRFATPGPTPSVGRGC